jgi:fatty-acyl-CoA synthase
VATARRPEVRLAKVVPAMLPPLLELSETPQLQGMIYGGAPIGMPLLEASLERFGPVLIQIYGQSEAPMTLTFLGRDEHLGDGDRRISAGRPWRSVALEVRGEDGSVLPSGEIGEIHVSGDHLMLGYRGMPEATDEVLRDGWLATRDVGYVDPEGYVFLMGRRDEMIISGGYNIAPREVERVLVDHPAIFECVVFGADDARWGQAVYASVVLGEDTVSEAEILEWVRPRLGFRTPKRITILDSIPKNPYGKVDRAALLGPTP